MSVHSLIFSFGLYLSQLPIKTCWNSEVWILSHILSLFEVRGGEEQGESWKCPQVETEPLTQRKQHFQTRVP